MILLHLLINLEVTLDEKDELIKSTFKSVINKIITHINDVDEDNDAAFLIMSTNEDENDNFHYIDSILTEVSATRNEGNNPNSGNNIAMWTIACANY